MRHTDNALRLSDDTPSVLSEEEQREILDEAIAEFAKDGWNVHRRPSPFAVSLEKKAGFMAKAFVALWVEEDGTLMHNNVAIGGLGGVYYS